MRTLVLLLTVVCAAAQTALLDAARAGRTKELEALVAKGAALESRDREGRTALMLAAMNGRATAVRLLLSRGADAKARDAHGWTPYMLALLDPAGGLRAHEAVLKLLPAPPRYRLAVNGMWSPAENGFQSCSLKPEQLMAEMRVLRPDGLVLAAFQRYAIASGRDLVAIVQSDALGTSEVPNKVAPEDVDATVLLTATPEIACGYRSDRVSLAIQAVLARGENEPRTLAPVESRPDTAANPRQYAPLLAEAAHRQAGAVYWAIVAALMEER